MANGDEHEEHEQSELLSGLGEFMAAKVQEHEQAHDRLHMQAERNELMVNNFLDSLDVDQLLALDMMFCVDRKSRANIYWHGIIVSMLRTVHKVNQEGKSLVTPEPPATGSQ